MRAGLRLRLVAGLLVPALGWGAAPSWLADMNRAFMDLNYDGVFSYFTSDAAPFELPGAPLLAGSLLMAVAMLLLVRAFRRH